MYFYFRALLLLCIFNLIKYYYHICNQQYDLAGNLIAAKPDKLNESQVPYSGRRDHIPLTSFTCVVHTHKTEAHTQRNKYTHKTQQHTHIQ